MARNRATRFALIAVAVFVFAFAYLFQDYFTASNLLGGDFSKRTDFILKKTIRIILNDSAALLLIHGWFYNTRISRLGFYLQLVDIVVLLPLYLLIKIGLEGPSEISSPLLSQLHRLIVNPILMILLIPAIYFQRLTSYRE